MLAIFPLGTVLFPGLLLPLHIFEERYRQLVRDLLERPEQEQQIGVIAIRQGREVGADGVSALYKVGCTARLRQVETYQDGRFDLVTVGADRFSLSALHTDRPYLTGDVEWLPDAIGEPDPISKGDDTGALDAAVRNLWEEYLDALSVAGDTEVDRAELPDDPLVLSYLVAATMLLDLPDRQDLLAQPDGRARLRRELSLLRREATFLNVLGAAPAPQLAHTPVSPN